MPAKHFGTNRDLFLLGLDWSLAALDRVIAALAHDVNAAIECLSLNLGAAFRWVFWLFLTSGHRWEKTGWALGFCLALFLPAGVYAAGAAWALAFGYPVWIGVAVVAFGIAHLGRWIGRQHDQTQNAPPPPPVPAR